jgi:hypothetical protein
MNPDEETIDSGSSEEQKREEWLRRSVARLKWELHPLYARLQREEGADDEFPSDSRKADTSRLDLLLEEIVILEQRSDSEGNEVLGINALDTVDQYMHLVNLHCDLLTSRLLTVVMKELLLAVHKLVPDEGSVEYLKRLVKEHSIFGSLSMIGFAALGWISVEMVSKGLTLPGVLAGLVLLRLLLGSWGHQLHRLHAQRRTIMAKTVLRICYLEVARGQFDPVAVCRRLQRIESEGIVCPSLIYSLLRLKTHGTDTSQSLTEESV